MEFLGHIKEVANKFWKNIERVESKSENENFKNKKPILICTHYDADGISSAAQIMRILKKLEKNFVVKVFKVLEEETIRELKKTSENFACILFLDLGSSFLESFQSFECDVYIIDHHDIEDRLKEKITKEKSESKLHLINYMNTEQNTEQIYLYETSTSILTYFFSSALCEISKMKDNMLEKIALIGFIGDNMDKKLSKLSNLFLKIVKEKNAVEIKKGLRIFSYSRPVHKALELSSLYIPGITGNSEKIVDMLRNLGISIKENGVYRKFKDLSKEEISRLVTAILTLRIENGNETNDETKTEIKSQLDFIGNIYLVKFFDMIEDVRELATLINSCGRLDNSHYAFSFLLGKKLAREKMEEIYIKYKFEILKALEMIKNDENIIQKENFVIIDLKNEINDSLIGVVCSMLINSNYRDIVVGMTNMKKENENNKTEKIKISIRTKNSSAINILRKVKEISGMGFEVGGHKNAGGAVIEEKQKNEFIKYLKKVLQEEALMIKV